MVDIPDLPEFKDLPLAVRRSPRKRWNFLVDLLRGDVVYDPETKTFSKTTENEPQATTRSIHIDVDDGADGIEGASVVIGETTKTTGSAGGCNFTGLTDGKHNVTVTADGYTEKTEEITVSENNTTFTISLTAAPAAETPGES